MSDPVSCYNLEQAVRFGRGLEKLGYHWYEEPLFDEDMHALRELTRVLEIPVVGTEVLAKHPTASPNAYRPAWSIACVPTCHGPVGSPAS